ncbi:MAG: hypothetical protein NC453_13760 [Muribaculum sp.]|nr:hypothetical protein [Muribaculum sp.]
MAVKDDTQKSYSAHQTRKELKDYLGECNAYEDPSNAKLQITDRTIV